MIAKRMLVVLILLPALCLSGCATIVGKDLFPLTVNSNPDGAGILIVDENGKKMFAGTTPTTVSLAAGESYFHAKTYTITFSKPGYADQYATVKSTISGWYFGNILLGGLIGMLIVDPITGKMWKLPTNSVSMDLTKKLAMGQKHPTLRIMTLSQIPDNLRKDLISIN